MLSAPIQTKNLYTQNLTKKFFFICFFISLFHFSLKLEAQVMCGYDLGRTDTVKAKLFQAEDEKLNQMIQVQIAKERSNRMVNGQIRNQSSGKIKSNSTALPPTVYVPVVYHIIDADPFTITDAMVQESLDDLNRAYAHQGAYSVDPLGEDTRIQFRLAQRTPTGEKSNGINRIKSFYDIVDVDLEDAALKNQIKWDPSKYANIWVVKKINGEIQPSRFECGQWTRMAYGGYASAGGGMVVAGLNTAVIAHEMGHYLSLLHTFQGTNCANNDCSTDGDRVCDTPPDRSTKGSPCSNPENSCGTDTLSGPFTVDVPDNISNFMDYGTNCPTVFTPGQGERMRAFLAVFNGGSLLVSDGVNPPCTDNINALYEITNNPFPITGSTVEFTNRSSGASSYEWWMKDMGSGTETIIGTSSNLNYLFAIAGTYQIKLKAFNATNTCSSSYYTQLLVSCGTVARFSPDKRIVASKTGIYEDTVTFKNHSENADSFAWYIRNNTTGIQELISNATDLKYSFPSAANYSIWLVASKASCTSTSQTFTLNVIEASSDAMLNIYSVNCYKNDSIRVYFGVTNNGIDTIPAGTIVRFYNRDTAQDGRVQMDTAFKLPTDILGKCSAVFVHIVKADRNRSDSLYMVLDEENNLKEISKTNNRRSKILFQPKRSISPKDTTVFVNSTQSFKLNYAPDAVTSILWSSSAGSFDCPSCINTSTKIVDTTYIKVKTLTQFGCEDSATAIVNIFPNDLVISSPAIYCYQNNDSVLVKTKICLLNGYEQLTRNIKVQYFDALKTELGAQLLYETIVPASTLFTNSCATIEHHFGRKSASNIYVYVNPDLSIYEDQVANNNISLPYNIFKIGVPVSQISIARGDPYPLSISQLGEPVTSIVWRPAFALNCTTCFTPILQTNSSTMLTVQASSEYGCKDSASIWVNAYYKSHLILPTVFTPNGDGKNDFFYVIAGREVVKVKLFTIMNRWGAVVFNKSGALPNSYADGWDGSYNGKPAEAGTYIYQLMVELSDGSTETKKGNITLIR